MGKRWNTEEGTLCDEDVNLALSQRTNMWLVSGHIGEGTGADDHGFRITVAPSPIEAARLGAADHKARDLALPPAWQVHPLRVDNVVLDPEMFAKGCYYESEYPAFQDCFILVRL